MQERFADADYITQSPLDEDRPNTDLFLDVVKQWLILVITLSCEWDDYDSHNTATSLVVAVVLYICTVLHLLYWVRRKTNAIRLTNVNIKRYTVLHKKWHFVFGNKFAQC